MNQTQKPILLYDGDCAFCKAHVARWKRKTGEAIEYAPCQEFPRVSREACARAVQLLMPDGTMYSAAEAVFRALHAAGKRKWWLWCYLHVPGCALVSECAYRWVARHRGALPF